MTLRHIPVTVMPHAGGYHQAAWRVQTTGNDIWNPELWRYVARTAERGMLDGIFLADNMSLWPVPEEVRHHTAKVGVWDAFMLGALIATVTEHIGIIATGHTEYHEPYALARQIACLDHLSGGRSGWNVVTSAGKQDAANFGREQPPTEERYARATEYIELVKALLDSWEDDAYVIDRERGEFFDPKKMHTTDHVGRYYTVKGPLNIMRPPQGHPVIAQAGGSGPGKILAGTYGELLFSPLSGEPSRKFRSEVRAIAAEAGRDPERVKLLSWFSPVLGRTDEEADERFSTLQGLLEPSIARGIIESKVGADLSGFPLDQPLPEDLKSTNAIEASRQAILTQTRNGVRPTLGELIRDFRDSGTVVGGPETIADYMEEQVDTGACDGFVMLMQEFPTELELFVDHVVPELQRRGRFRTEYPGGTFREMLGLERPRNRFVPTGAS